jgi:predicted O-methyltransferase YrrM
MTDLIPDGPHAYPRRVDVTEANEVTVKFIHHTRCQVIAELGVYRGHTSLEFAKFLNGAGELHLYDYEDRVAEVAKTLAERGYTNVRTFGCSYKLLDSYCWPLAKMLESHPEPIYDFIFIDGAHTWAVDALATLLSDRLLKVGGFLDFDDYLWTLAGSRALTPKNFPLTGKLYTQEQIDAWQVKMIVELLIRRDRRYREIVPSKIFQKIAN